MKTRHAFPEIIVSGGQTVAERAGLDFAIEHGIAHAGYCPKRQGAERAQIPDQYNLVETATDDGLEYVKINVEMADATVVFNPASHISPHPSFVLLHAEKIGKPCVMLPHFPDLNGDVAVLLAFLREHFPYVLNVAGSPESEHPGLNAYIGAVFNEVVVVMDREKPLALSGFAEFTEGFA